MIGSILQTRLLHALALQHCLRVDLLPLRAGQPWLTQVLCNVSDAGSRNEVHISGNSNSKHLLSDGIYYPRQQRVPHCICVCYWCCSVNAAVYGTYIRMSIIHEFQAQLQSKCHVSKLHN